MAKAEYGRGIKAGAIAGLVQGIIYFVLVAALGRVFYPGFMTTVPTGTLLAWWAPTYIAGGIIGGVIFGVIYAAAYKSLPRSSVVKGIILSIIFWLAYNIGLGYFNIGLSFGTIVSYPLFAVFGLISSLVWGALVGILWDKFGK